MRCGGALYYANQGTFVLILTILFHCNRLIISAKQRGLKKKAKMLKKNFDIFCF